MTRRLVCGPALASGLLIAFTGCSTAPVACDSSGLAVVNGFVITVTGLPATTESVTVTACIGTDCRHTTVTSFGHQTMAFIEHPAANASAPVTVTISATHNRRLVGPSLTRTLTPRHIVSTSPTCHPDQHIIELTLKAVSTH